MPSTSRRSDRSRDTSATGGSPPGFSPSRDEARGGHGDECAGEAVEEAQAPNQARRPPSPGAGEGRRRVPKHRPSIVAMAASDLGEDSVHGNAPSRAMHPRRGVGNSSRQSSGRVEGARHVPAPRLSPRGSPRMRLQGQSRGTSRQATSAAIKEALRAITGTSARRPSTAFSSMVAEPTFPYGLVARQAGEVARAQSHQRRGAVTRARELRRGGDGEEFAATSRAQRVAIRRLEDMGIDLEAIEAATGRAGATQGAMPSSNALQEGAPRQPSPSRLVRRLSASSILDMGLESGRRDSPSPSRSGSPPPHARRPQHEATRRSGDIALASFEDRVYEDQSDASDSPSPPAGEPQAVRRDEASSARGEAVAADDDGTAGGSSCNEASHAVPQGATLPRGQYPSLPPYISPLAAAEDGLPTPGEEVDPTGTRGVPSGELLRLAAADSDELALLELEPSPAAADGGRARSTDASAGSKGRWRDQGGAAAAAAAVRGRGGGTARGPHAHTAVHPVGTASHEAGGATATERAPSRGGGAGDRAYPGPVLSSGVAGRVHAPPLTSYAAAGIPSGRTGRDGRPNSVAEVQRRPHPADDVASGPHASRRPRASTRLGVRREVQRTTQDAKAGHPQVSHRGASDAGGRKVHSAIPIAGWGEEGEEEEGEDPSSPATLASRAHEAEVDLQRVKARALRPSFPAPSQITRSTLPRPYSRPGTGGGVLGQLSSWSLAEDGVSLRQVPSAASPAGPQSVPALPALRATPAGSGPSRQRKRKLRATRQGHGVGRVGGGRSAAATLTKSMHIYNSVGRGRAAVRGAPLRRAPARAPQRDEDPNHAAAGPSAAAARLYAQAQALHAERNRRIQAAQEEVEKLAARTARGKVLVPTREERLAAHKAALAAHESMGMYRDRDRRPMDAAAREHNGEGPSRSEAEGEGALPLSASPGEREAVEALQMRRHELARALELAQQGRGDQEVLEVLGHSSQE